MTRTALGTLGLLMASTGLATAGALDRTGQPVTIIFEEGNYVELSYGFTMPEVSGVATDPFTGGLTSSGNVGVDYSQVALSFKYDVTDRVSLALVIDQPFGADVDYGDADAGYPVGGSVADFFSTGVTAIGRYEVNEAFSVHAGARWVEIDADLFVSAFGGLATYESEYEPDSDVGYLVGVAYERPAIALRVALTYSSETEFSHETTYSGTLAGTGTTAYTMPQSVNLDFRTGIAEGTAILGSVRWVDWSETSIDSPGYAALFGTPVVDYDGDYVTYTLGVGRAFSPRFLGSAAVIYEDGLGGEVSNLSPYDGQRAVQLGGTYLVGNGLELTGGLRYTLLGDATTNTILAEFEDNDALSLAVRVGYRF